MLFRIKRAHSERLKKFFIDTPPSPPPFPKEKKKLFCAQCTRPTLYKRGWDGGKTHEMTP